jgi:hypothetical protein
MSVFCCSSSISSWRTLRILIPHIRLCRLIPTPLIQLSTLPDPLNPASRTSLRFLGPSSGVGLTFSHKFCSCQKTMSRDRIDDVGEFKSDKISDWPFLQPEASTWILVRVLSKRRHPNSKHKESCLIPAKKFHIWSPELGPSILGTFELWNFNF